MSEEYGLKFVVNGEDYDKIKKSLNKQIEDLQQKVEQLEKENIKQKEIIENLTTMTVCGDKKQIKNTAQYKLEQLENIINEAKEECKSVIEDSEHTTVSEFNINGLMRTILNILDNVKTMKKMIYQKDRKIELLYQGKYKGYKYYILNLGTHPTAYIEIPKNNALFKKHYNKIDLDVHGGLTYSESVLFIDENEKAEGEWFIGWDYAHYDDYAGFYDEMDFISRYYKLKKWTTEEIKQECENAIDELKDKEHK